MDGGRPWVRGSGCLIDALVTQDNTDRIGCFKAAKRFLREFFFLQLYKDAFAGVVPVSFLDPTRRFHSSA